MELVALLDLDGEGLVVLRLDRLGDVVLGLRRLGVVVDELGGQDVEDVSTAGLSSVARDERVLGVATTRDDLASGGSSRGAVRVAAATARGREKRTAEMLAIAIARDFTRMDVLLRHAAEKGGSIGFPDDPGPPLSAAAIRCCTSHQKPRRTLWPRSSVL
uniref:Uncharacterized protein n=1 Tax=Janibacter limosus TaxID=53458 RepID=A0AC61U610_9MICO|nr:hypothetical protein [Janibacter limosus]